MKPRNQAVVGCIFLVLPFIAIYISHQLEGGFGKATQALIIGSVAGVCINFRYFINVARALPKILAGRKASKNKQE